MPEPATRMALHRLDLIVCFESRALSTCTLTNSCPLFACFEYERHLACLVTINAAATVLFLASLTLLASRFPNNPRYVRWISIEACISSCFLRRRRRATFRPRAPRQIRWFGFAWDKTSEPSRKYEANADKIRGRWRSHLRNPTLFRPYQHKILSVFSRETSFHSLSHFASFTPVFQCRMLSPPRRPPRPLLPSLSAHPMPPLPSCPPLHAAFATCPLVFSSTPRLPSGVS